MNETIALALLWALSLLNLANSLYFTLLIYGVIGPHAAFVPRACRLGEQSCESIIHSRYAHVFGIPNSVLGLLYYTALLAMLAVRAWTGRYYYLEPLFLLSLLAVVLAPYFIWALLVRLKVPCPL